MSNPVIHFDIVGGDAGVQQQYYRDLFGWQIQPTGGPGNYALVSAVAGGIAGGIGEGVGDPTPRVVVYVGVADVEEALARADELGGTRLFGPDKVPGADIELGQFTDPAGHVVGVLKTA